MNARDSLTGRLLIDGGTRLRAALATATITGWFLRLTNEQGQQLRTAVTSATVVTWIRAAGQIGRSAFEGSALSRLLDWLGQVTRASWSYRWLTAEPDPDVVVIDLRETLLVGPVLGLLDWILDPVVRNWQRAESRTLFERIEAAVRDRPVQVLSLVALAAVVANVALSVALGSPSSRSLGIGLLVATLALAGTRVDLSVSDFVETRTYALVAALLEPPEPPEESDREQP